MIRWLIYTFLVTWPFFIESWANKLVLETGEGIPKLDITRTFCMVILLLTLIYKFAQRKKMKIDVIVFMTLLYSIYFFLEIVFNDVGVKLSTAFAGLSAFCVVPCIIYFVLVNLKDDLNRRYLVHAVLFAGIYTAGSGIIEFIVGHNVFGPSNQLSVDYRTGFFRTNGPFWDVISYAGIVLSLVPFTYWALKEKLVNKPFAYFCLILFSLGALASLSRSVMIAFVFVWGVLLLGKDWKKILLIYFLVMICGVIGYFISDVFLSSSLYKHRLSIGSGGRYEQFLLAIKTFWHNPVFGSGFGVYTKIHKLGIHNSFLSLLVDFGLVGLILYIPLLISLLFYRFKAAIEETSFIRAKLCLALIVFIVSSFIDLLGSSPFIITLYIVTAVMNTGDRGIENVAITKPTMKACEGPDHVIGGISR